MDNITLAIPVYNTSSYFEQAVEYALSNNFVKEIVVSDDSSRDDEWEKLNKIVSTLNTDKIKKTFMLELPHWDSEVKRVLREII